MGVGSQVKRLAELWERSEHAGEGELDELRTLTAVLCARADAAAGMLSAAWRLTSDVERKLGRSPEASPRLARARGAALSARHASNLLLAELRETLAASRSQVALLSEIAVCQRLFGRCDVVAPHGALIVPLGNDDDGTAEARIPFRDGVRWGRPGRLGPFLSERPEEVDVEGCRFVLPPVDVLPALLATDAGEGGETAGLLLAVAVAKCQREGRWAHAREVAAEVGGQFELRSAMARWRIDGEAGGLNVVRFMRRFLGGRRAGREGLNGGQEPDACGRGFARRRTPPPA
jgi:hypothetical protein